ncbi:MAG: hypothetical protein RLZZ175_2263 [Bacteroidota bacterium]|jgi:hypothetical protein
MSYEFSETYWSDYNQFLLLVKQILDKNECQKQFESPSLLIETWKEIVDSGHNYSFSVYDWQTDISIRNLIELILNEESIKKIEYFYSPDFRKLLVIILNNLLKCL